MLAQILEQEIAGEMQVHHSPDSMTYVVRAYSAPFSMENTLHTQIIVRRNDILG